MGEKKSKKAKKSLTKPTIVPETNPDTALPTFPLKKEKEIRKERETTIRKKVRFLNNFIKQHGIITPAAKSANITRQQVLTWRKEDKEFNEKFIEAEAIACEFVESKMMNQIESGNTTLTIFYLVNRSKGRWENIQKVEQRPDDNTTKKIDELLSRTAKLAGLDK
jgi:hypothetical protein